MSIRITFTLTQITPIAHFDYDNECVTPTIRVTEVKPKLDRFLKKMYSRSHTDESMPEGWFIVDSSGERTEALDYKMQITPQANSSRQFEIRKNDYSNKYNFLANMGGDEARRDGTHEGAAKFVMENHPLSGQIVSFHESLLAFMNEPIVENLTPIDMFFACTNFGMRQDKGFGEFVTNPLLLQGPSANDLFEEVLNSVYGNYVYSTELEKGRKGVLRKEFNDLEPACRTIGKVYKRLKSGKENFVHVYFSQNSNSRVKDYTVSNLYKRSFENEKDVCKRDGANADGAVYGKALFGLANEIKIKEGTWTIGSRDEQNAISRIKSPVTFRVLYDTVYMFLDFDYCDEQRMASYAMLAGRPITVIAENGQKEFSIPLPPNPPEGTLIDVYHDIFEKFVQFVKEKGLDQPESSSGKQQSSWNKGSHGSYKHDNTQNTTHKNQKHSNKIVIKEGKKL
ncbi:MAG: hypothetical protein D8G53_03440 [Candidatus Saccharimonas sp.]|nr:MAG: hypothetical protein D8G53_03440 [Candidatus Saccharimonas sp.]